MLDGDAMLLDALLPGLVLCGGDGEADMDLAIRPVRRHAPRLAGPPGTEEKQNTGSHPEEHVTTGLFPDLAKRHDFAVEVLGPIEIGHV